ncbi:hypothetical protein L914_21754, partial [Phytophthora nicotianae]
MAALAELRRVFTSVSGGRQLLVKFVMADAEAAQQNAVTRVFGVDCEFVYLMCFYHVMAKVHEKLKDVPEYLSKQVMADIYDLHCADSQDVYDEQVQQIITKCGYATTNNPVEQFNRLIKRDYTLRPKHKIGALFQLLADCCGHQS